ncbi:MAG TPA: HAD family hydrolase [Egibacteraceae bacterium]|nr:HAD family hydrolase [Actinomycetota bacterium]HWB71872.1 HAD family hydrolase [Egibacteraceae bacterium]
MATDRYRYGVVLDLDGTLVDSVFHHVMTWAEAFREYGHEVPMWRIHAAVGMGSKRLVAWLLGEHVPEEEAISDSHRRRFLDRAGELRPTNGAATLVDDLEGRGVSFVVATSAGAEVREALLATLGMKDLPTTDADDVESAKPAPDLLLAACSQLDIEPADAILIGDSPWDAEAGGRVGLRTIAVRCGGFADQQLISAGAVAVVDDPRALIGWL